MHYRFCVIITQGGGLVSKEVKMVLMPIHRGKKDENEPNDYLGIEL